MTRPGGRVKYHAGHSTVSMVLLGRIGIWQNRLSEWAFEIKVNSTQVRNQSPRSPCTEKLEFEFINLPEGHLLGVPMSLAVEYDVLPFGERLVAGLKQEMWQGL